MKKIMFAAVALMAFVAVSCQKEETVETLPTFTAHADNGGMKTDLVGNYICWNSTDQVKVFGEMGYAIYGVTPRSSDPTWATLTAIENYGITASQPYRFVYPAEMAEGGSANNTLYVTYPSARNINDAPLKYFPMYGESDHLDVAFRNVGGLIKLELPAIERNVASICITADEHLVGTFAIDAATAGCNYSAVDDYFDGVRINANMQPIAGGSEVYVAVPANVYHNLTISIYDNTGYVATKSGSAVNVAQSAITTINVSNLEFVPTPATLKERAFFECTASSIVFHYNYADVVPGATRIDDRPSDPTETPIYQKMNGTTLDVYTPAATINAPENCRFLFGYSNTTAIDFGDGFNTANVRDMFGMFFMCNSLTSLHLSHFNTANVTDMTVMFGGCSSLTSLGLSSFNTANVTGVREMFSGCSSLTSLDLSSFNTANVVYMYAMFGGCSSLTSLDLSTFNTANVADMQNMFSGCSSLTSLDLTSFNTANVVYMFDMFNGCSSLTSLDLSSFNTANVTSMEAMFLGCSSLTSLDLSSFNTANVTEMRGLFEGCSSLTSLDLSSFNTANVVSMVEMFCGCYNLTSLDLSSFSSNSLTLFWSVFEGCTNLESIRFSSGFTLDNSVDVNTALSGVGSTRTCTIKCNSQTKSILMNGDSCPSSGVVWDLY